MIDEVCESRSPTSGEPNCRHKATHIHQIRDQDGEVYEEMYICSRHAKNCKACRPLPSRGTAKEEE